MRIIPAILLMLVSWTVLADGLLADRVVVNKTERRLYLMQKGQVLKSYKIALGLMPAGHKVREGDFRTPEGDYFLTRRVIDSDYFMSIMVSYPDRTDYSNAKNLGVTPGGNIMIHGQPNQPKKAASYYANYDWTDGCIAVSNQAMTEIWQLTTIDTPVSILP
jgi:murein L,D-transpeptidase YafK